MNYFNGITNLEQAKTKYKKSAKQLHPDKGGNAVEFQKMQVEFNSLLLKIQHNRNAIASEQTPEKEFIDELAKLARVLIKNQVPQNYLRQKMQITESPVRKGVLNNIVDFLDRL